MKLHSIPEIINDIRLGRFVILVDDEDRENEGDLMIAADFVTPESINFMASTARGLICLALTPQQIERLQLPLMVREDLNGSPHRTAFTLSIEAARGVSTGISAADRALTIKVASDPSSSPQDIIVPGHVFPIKSQTGGVLKRAGHTEASVDLALLAGLKPAAAICEIMNADGSMARLPDLLQFSEKYNIKISSIEQLIQYRLENESFVQQVAQAPFRSKFGNDFEVRVFRNQLDGLEHVVLSKGDLSSKEPLLVRVQVEDLLSDVFGGTAHGHDDVLRRSLQMIESRDRGALVYIRRSSSLHVGREVSETKNDDREYGVGAQILRSLGVHQIQLLSNSPAKRVGLKAFGIEIVETLAFEAHP